MIKSRARQLKKRELEFGIYPNSAISELILNVGPQTSTLMWRVLPSPRLFEGTCKSLGLVHLTVKKMLRGSNEPKRIARPKNPVS